MRTEYLSARAALERLKVSMTGTDGPHRGIEHVNRAIESLEKLKSATTDMPEGLRDHIMGILKAMKAVRSVNYKAGWKVRGTLYPQRLNPVNKATAFEVEARLIEIESGSSSNVFLSMSLYLNGKVVLSKGDCTLDNLFSCLNTAFTDATL